MKTAMFFLALVAFVATATAQTTSVPVIPNMKDFYASFTDTTSHVTVTVIDSSQADTTFLLYVSGPAAIAIRSTGDTHSTLCGNRVTVANWTPGITLHIAAYIPGSNRGDLGVIALRRSVNPQGLTAEMLREINESYYAAK